MTTRPMTSSGEDSFEAAFRAAVQNSRSELVGHNVSATELKAAEERARTIVQNSDGAKDLQNAAIAIGLPAARILLRHLVEAGEAKKKKLLNQIEQISPITEHGSIEVVKNVDDKSVKFHLMLDECDKNHNLDAELDKLKKYVSDKEWKDTIVKHLSMLGSLGKFAYSKFVIENPELIQEIGENLEDKIGKRVNFLDLKIDNSNTTFYVLEDHPKRVGIFVRSESESDSHS